MNDNTDNTFKQKYGPWAVISGASDGTGAAFARRLAAQGLNLVLLARREALLESLSIELADTFGVQVRFRCVDLYEADAGQQVLDAANGLDVGLFVSNAGVDVNQSGFLDAPFAAWQQLISRNIIAVTQAIHGFAQAMRERQRGGILLMSSVSALGGQPGLSVYCGTKGYDLNFAESLWVELKPYSVDVLSGVCPAMNTPTVRNYFPSSGEPSGDSYEPEDVVNTLLAKLGDGPLYIFEQSPHVVDAAKTERERREQIAVMATYTEQLSKGY